MWRHALSVAKKKWTLYAHAQKIARHRPSKNIYSFVMFSSQIPVITRSELTGSMTSRTSGYQEKLKYEQKYAPNRAQPLIIFPLPRLLFSSCCLHVLLRFPFLLSANHYVEWFYYKQEYVHMSVEDPIQMTEYVHLARRLVVFLYGMSLAGCRNCSNVYFKTSEYSWIELN